MIKKNIFLGAFILCSNCLFAQYAHEFLILDDVTAQPFANVDITVYDTTMKEVKMRTKTNNTGTALVENLSNGTYKVVLSKQKYISIEKYIEINKEKLDTFSEKPYSTIFTEILIPKKKTKSAIIRDEGVPPPTSNK